MGQVFDAAADGTVFDQLERHVLVGNSERVGSAMFWRLDGASSVRTGHDCLLLLVLAVVQKEIRQEPIVIKRTRVFILQGQSRLSSPMLGEAIFRARPEEALLSTKHCPALALQSADQQISEQTFASTWHAQPEEQKEQP